MTVKRILMNLKITIFVTWLLLITYLSIIPTFDIDTLKHSDKIIHLLIYFFTSFIFYYSFRLQIKRIIPFAILFSIIFGTLMEVLQITLSYRSFSVEDIMANSMGALIAGAFLRCKVRYLTSSQQ